MNLSRSSSAQLRITKGNIRDPNWYSEPTKDGFVSSDNSSLPRIIEKTMKLTEDIWGNGPTDSSPHRHLSMGVLFSHYSQMLGIKTYLFDLEKDPEERTDLSASDPELLEKMLNLLERERQKKPKAEQQKYWVLDEIFEKNPAKTFRRGNCTGAPPPENKYEKCLFVHPWVEENSQG